MSTFWKVGGTVGLLLRKSSDSGVGILAVGERGGSRRSGDAGQVLGLRARGVEGRAAQAILAAADTRRSTRRRLEVIGRSHEGEGGSLGVPQAASTSSGAGQDRCKLAKPGRLAAPVIGRSFQPATSSIYSPYRGYSSICVPSSISKTKHI